MIVEQALLPHYNPASQAISDLGNSALYGSDALIFNVSVFTIGVLSMLGALLLSTFVPHRGEWRVGLVMLFLAGLGAMCVGLFPEEVNPLAHSLSALGAFVGGGLALIMLARSASVLVPRAWVRPSMILGGLVDLGAIVAFVLASSHSPYYGAIERVIVIPVLAWALVYGGLLLSGAAKVQPGSVPGAAPV